MTEVVFEAAALADALTKAAKVAPSRGEAFDKAAGLLIDITADEAVIMATDTQTKYATWLTPESINGPPVQWRLPSRIFADVVSKLKTTMNKTLSLKQNGTQILLAHGRSTRAQFMLMDPTSYPIWTPFSPDDMKEAEGLGGIAAAVQWACSKGTDVPFTGVHFDGKIAIATDKYRFACSPCPLDINQPLTVPAGAISSILKPDQTVLVRTDGSQLYIMPDEFTQISLTAYGLNYPPVKSVMLRTHPRTVKVTKSSLVDMLNLAATMTGSDRMPVMRLIFGRGEVAAMMENEQIGLLGHVIEVPGQLDFSKREEVRLKPENIMGALDGCPAPEVTLGYDPDKPKQAFYINGGGGLEYWVAPRQKSDEPGTES